MQNISPIRLLIKVLLFFLILNILFILFAPYVGNLSIYNRLIAGRLRFPFASGRWIDSSMDELDAMFDSHVIAAGTKPPNEFRVVLLGDSSVWGELLTPDQTLSEQLNADHILCNGRNVRSYNLGYPHPSLIKDFVILAATRKYKPDLVIWLVTLDTFRDNSLNPFVVTNQSQAISVVNQYHISFDTSSLKSGASVWEQTLMSQRSRLARLMMLQLYGIYWAGVVPSPVDPNSYPPVANNFHDDPTFAGYKTGSDLSATMFFSWVNYIYQIADGIPLVVVNEPIFISTGRNSNVRYDSFYPRWAYDQYRAIMNSDSSADRWNYVDLWNIISAAGFSDTALHLSPVGEQKLAAALIPIIQKNCIP
jgi:hypothetical protein